MTSGKRSRQQRNDAKPLTVAVKTMLVGGRQITTKLLQQVNEENILDEETAILRGEPIGYFNVHSRECPPEQHLHILWTRANALYRSLAVLSTESPSYQNQEQQYAHRIDNLTDLIALLEAQHARAQQVPTPGEIPSSKSAVTGETTKPEESDTEVVEEIEPITV